MKKAALLLLTLFITLLCIAQQLYTPIDNGSKVHFVIKNFAIKTGGDFSGLRGAIYFDPAKLGASSIDVSVDASTVDTDSEMRDDHLKEDEYFDVAKYPTITFRSTAITVHENAIKVKGLLAIKEIKQEIEFDAKFLGIVPDPRGNIKAGFEMDLAFDRKDFNITWNEFFDKQGILISDQVKLHADVQLLKIK